VKAAEILVNEMQNVYKQSAVPAEKKDQSTEEPKLQRDTGKKFVADIIATLETYDKGEHIEVSKKVTLF
jgi:hypothetical protein